MRLGPPHDANNIHGPAETDNALTDRCRSIEVHEPTRALSNDWALIFWCNMIAKFQHFDMDSFPAPIGSPLTCQAQSKGFRSG